MPYTEEQARRITEELQDFIVQTMVYWHSGGSMTAEHREESRERLIRLLADPATK